MSLRETSLRLEPHASVGTRQRGGRPRRGDRTWKAPRSRARSLVESLAAAWLAGDHDTVSAACTPDVRWWTPADGRGPATRSGRRERRPPARLSRRCERPVEVTAVVPSDDGNRCVVEMRSAATAARALFVTSVLTLRDGKVSAGRTYTDLRQADPRPEPRRHERALVRPLDGRRALVTGSSRNLGAEIARSLAPGARRSW